MLQHAATLCNTWTPIASKTAKVNGQRCSILGAVVHDTLQHAATRCNTLQHATTRCNTLQHATTRCNTLQHAVTHCNTLQHTATHCNTLQHARLHIDIAEHTTRCNTLQHLDTDRPRKQEHSLRCSVLGAVVHDTLQHAATRCRKLQQTATRTTASKYCNTHNALQHCNTWKQITLENRNTVNSAAF